MLLIYHPSVGLSIYFEGAAFLFLGGLSYLPSDQKHILSKSTEGTHSITGQGCSA